MSVQVDFSLARYEDGVLTVSMEPPVPIGGWTIQFAVVKNFGGTNYLINKSVASGYNNASGINILNSGNGVFNVNINGVDTSGMNYGNYAHATTRLDSGAYTVLAEGNFTIGPSMG